MCPDFKLAIMLVGKVLRLLQSLAVLVSEHVRKTVGFGGFWGVLGFWWDENTTILIMETRKRKGDPTPNLGKPRIVPSETFT